MKMKMKMKKTVLVAFLIMSSNSSFSAQTEGPAADCNAAHAGAKNFGCCSVPKTRSLSWVGTTAPVLVFSNLVAVCKTANAEPSPYCELDKTIVFNTTDQKLPATDCIARDIHRNGEI